jgi:hypothetical protein
MRVFVGSPASEEKSGFTNLTLDQLDKIENGEAAHVECDGILSSYKNSEFLGILSLVSKKVKIGGTITIIEPDISLLLVQHAVHNSITLQELNDHIFCNGPIGCVLDLEGVCNFLSSNFSVSTNKFQGSIYIQGKRLK